MTRPSPIARRDRLVASATRSLIARGETPDVEAIQRQAARDLAMLDRARAAGDIRTASSAPRPAPKPAGAANPAAAMAAARGSTYFLENISKREKVEVIPTVTPRQAALTKRIAELLRLRSLAGSLTKAMDERDFLYPAYAKKILESWRRWFSASVVANKYADQLARSKAGGITDASQIPADALAKIMAESKVLAERFMRRPTARFSRELEKIADSSNAVAGLGPWFTK